STMKTASRSGWACNARNRPAGRNLSCVDESGRRGHRRNEHRPVVAGFHLGAWGTLFFDQQLTVWAASVGALVVVLLQRPGRPKVWKSLALLVPSLWLVLSFLPFDDDHP